MRAFDPKHLSMPRELNCNRGSPKIHKRSSAKFKTPSKIGLSCSVFASRFLQYAPEDSRRGLDISSSVACRAIPLRPQRSVECIPRRAVIEKARFSAHGREACGTPSDLIGVAEGRVSQDLISNSAILVYRHFRVERYRAE
jgi:hypothetical protein